MEKVDKILLRNILDAHRKTPVEWMYADTGKLDMKSLIQIRRMMFLWHILSRNESELIYRVYQSQKISSNRGDWVRMIESDKKELNIHMTDEEIKGVSKQMFKTIVKEKVKARFIQHINSLKAQHSKSKYLECSELKMAEYIEDNRLNDTEKKLLFKLRSKTLDVKKNFGNHENPWCTSCGLTEETQGHLLQCPPLIRNLNYLIGGTSVINENHIYGNIEEQIRIVHIYSDILPEREKIKLQRLRDNIPQPEGPLHPTHLVGGGAAC